MSKGRSRRGSKGARRDNSRDLNAEDGPSDFRRDRSIDEGNEVTFVRVEESDTSLTAKQETEENLGRYNFSEDLYNAILSDDAEDDDNFCEETVMDLNGTGKELKNHENEGSFSQNERGRYLCDHCGYRTSSRMDLVNHISYGHENKRKSSLIDFKGKKIMKTSHNDGTRSAGTTPPIRRLPPERLKIEYTCDLCSEFRARNLIEVLTHRASHLDPKNKIQSPLNKASIAAVNGNGRKSVPIEYDCCWCDFKASNLLGVLGHIRARHPAASGPRVYTCDVCSFRTPHLITLMSHRSAQHSAQPRLKSPQPPVFNCDMCKFKTSDREKLDRHTSRHAGQILNSCDLCNYKTLRPDRFDAHLRTKHTERDQKN